MATITKITNKKVASPKKKIEPTYRNNNNNFECICVEELLSDLNDDFDFEYASVDVELDNKTVSFETTGLKNCCGVIELGNLECQNTVKLDDLAEFLDGIVSIGGGLTFMINTVSSGSCATFEKALAKCKYFTKVKSFKNPNSGNIITTWLSNNG